ncbi:MAG TPA: MurR/RpiR family transcriptional regulator [Chloroflexota bacterium]|nr:MurR/RpiR family transcriptional regulator [Chloroflexota bacterium]
MLERAPAQGIRDGAGKVLLRLQSALPGLSPAEQRLAAYILDHPDEILYMSVHQLSELSGVSAGTVVRFCQEFGYAGFAEFKLMLAADAVAPVRTVMGDIAPQDDIRTIAEKIMTANVLALEDTMRLFDADAMARAVRAVAAAPRLEVFAVGASTVVAMDAKYKFTRIGKQVDAVADPHQQAMTASLMQPGDVAIAVTYSGDTKDIVESVARAKQAGAAVITITAHSRSQVASLSDLILLTGPMETPLASGAIRSTIAQLHVLDVLVAGVFLHDPEKALRAVERTAEAVAGKLL